MIQKLSSFTVVAFFTFCLYILLLFFVKLDTEFVYRWPLLFFYFVTLLILPLFLLITNSYRLKKGFAISKIYFASPKGKQELWIFLLVAVLSVATRFLFLKDYPFITWGDELWDTGLDTLLLLSGEAKNFYLLGFPDSYRMPSMGLIITLIPSLFA